MDGYGNAAVDSIACGQPTGYVATAGDCNDMVAAIRPGVTEVTNGYDDNCDGIIDEVAGFYRSAGSGSWHSTTTWQMYNGISWGPTLILPSATSGPVSYTHLTLPTSDLV